MSASSEVGYERDTLMSLVLQVSMMPLPGSLLLFVRERPDQHHRFLAWLLKLHPR